MASITNIILTDDIDGTSKDVTNVLFGLDGVTYEIDLSEKNNKKLRDALAVFLESARYVRPEKRVGTVRQPARSQAAPTNSERKEKLAAIREWAALSGIQVAPRGRIAAEVEAQYDEALAEANS